MRAATMLNRWLEELIRAAREGRVVSTSAGAGPERDYAYLHYRLDDDEHSVLVFRNTSAGGATVVAFRCDGDDEAIAERVEWATHEASPARAS